jgi:hypothetical protein
MISLLVVARDGGAIETANPNFLLEIEAIAAV